MLNKKREQKAKLELSGKPDRGNTAGVEVIEVCTVYSLMTNDLINVLLFIPMCHRLVTILICLYSGKRK